MPKKSKFKVRQIVSVNGNEGELMETVDNGDGTFQHRVRADMSDIWVPEKQLELVRDVEEEDQRKTDELQESRKSGDQKHDEEINALVGELEKAGDKIIELGDKLTIAAEAAEAAAKKITELEDRVAELNGNDTPPAPKPAPTPTK